MTLTIFQASSHEERVVSEYQYYEFQALDRPLTDDEMDEVRDLSTRAEITRTSFTNEYHWGDFRGKPLEMMKHYYDAHLYFANWGTHSLMLRVPRSSVDVVSLRPYCGGEGLDLHLTRGHVILEFHADAEGADWDEVEAQLAPLIPLREALMAGDLRPLYLGWLSSIQSYPDDEEAVEPPVPPGMDRLTGALRALADFLYLDNDLLALAAEKSSGAAPTDVTGEEAVAWALRQPTAVKDEWLRRLIQEEGILIRTEIWRQARREQTADQTAAPPVDAGRTVGELLAALEVRHEESRRQEEERQRKKREEAEKKRAAEQTQRLNTLAAREEDAWREVDQLVATNQPKSYDQAVEILRDLWVLAQREGRGAAATARLRDLRQKFARKRTFIERMDKVGLPG